MRIHIPVIILGLVLTTLLIGQRFDARWAGGEGYAPPLEATVMITEPEANIHHLDTIRTASPGESLARGEVVETGSDERVVLRIGDVKIAMDERTVLTLENLDPQMLILRVKKGRLVISSDAQPVEIRTNYTKSRFETGLVSFVNYDFKESIGLAPIDTETMIKTDFEERTTAVPVEFSETQDIPIINKPFSPLEGAAADFHTWAAEQLEITWN